LRGADAARVRIAIGWTLRPAVIVWRRPEVASDAGAAYDVGWAAAGECGVPEVGRAVALDVANYVVEEVIVDRVGVGLKFDAIAVQADSVVGDGIVVGAGDEEDAAVVVRAGSVVGDSVVGAGGEGDAEAVRAGDVVGDGVAGAGGEGDAFSVRTNSIVFDRAIAGPVLEIDAVVESNNDAVLHSDVEMAIVVDSIVVIRTRASDTVAGAV
jgi:hypothetical protein